jgi:hypothetical protein
LKGETLGSCRYEKRAREVGDSAFIMR